MKGKKKQTKKSLFIHVVMIKKCIKNWQIGFIFLLTFLLGITTRSEVKSLSCIWLCDPMDCSLPSSSVHGIVQARVLEWVAIFFYRGSSRPRDRTWVSCIAGRHFTIWAKIYLNLFQRILSIWRHRTILGYMAPLTWQWSICFPDQLERQVLQLLIPTFLFGLWCSGRGERTLKRIYVVFFRHLLRTSHMWQGDRKNMKHGSYSQETYNVKLER